MAMRGIYNTKKRRPAVIEGDIARIPIGRDAKDGYAIVDKEFAYLDYYCWHLANTGYPVATLRGKPTHRQDVLLHQMVMGVAPDGLVTDHKDRDKLNNRRGNLRFINHVDNNRNCSRHSSRYPYRGVRFNGHSWLAYLTYRGKQIHLGSHKTAEEAALAYNAGASRYFGDIAILNEVTA